MSGSLQVKNLSRAFGGNAAVNDVTFDVRSGEIVGLIGPNGAGKSTTFNLISGFLKPTSGKVMFQDRDVTGKSPEQLSRAGLIRTFQHSLLFPNWTVHENVYIGTVLLDLPKAEREKRTEKILTLFSLQPVARFPSGNLPHGNQRLLGMAIAVATHPKLLLLDEPLTGMNATETNNALQLLKRVREEMDVSIVIVEHNIQAIMELCDRVVVLNFGKKIAEGTPEEVKNDARVIQAYLGDDD